MTDIDVRDSSYYSYRYRSSEEKTIRIRFQITDHHYLYHRIVSRDYRSAKVEPEMVLLTTKNVGTVNYRVELRYEKPTMPYEIGTFVFNNSVIKMPHEECFYVSDYSQVVSMFEFIFRVDYEKKTCSIPKALYDDFQSYSMTA